MKNLVLLTALLLTGCVSQNTALVNHDGKTVHCNSWGFGIIGAPVSMAEHADCVKKANAAGYSEAPATAAK